MSRKEDILYKKLIAVDDTYDDFVMATFSIAKHYGIVDELVDYIESHPSALSSEIIKERFRLAFGTSI